MGRSKAYVPNPGYSPPSMAAAATRSIDHLEPFMVRITSIVIARQGQCMAPEGGVSNISIGVGFIAMVVVHNILKCLVIMYYEDQGRPSTIDLRSKKEGTQPARERKKMFS